MRIWNLSTGQRLQTWSVTRPVKSVAIDDRSVIAGCLAGPDGGFVYIWDLESRSLRHRVCTGMTAANQVHIWHGCFAVVGTRDSIAIYDIFSGAQTGKHHAVVYTPGSLQVSSTGMLFAMEKSGSFVRVSIDPITGGISKMSSFVAKDVHVVGCIVLKDNIAVIGTDQSDIRVYNFASGCTTSIQHGMSLCVYATCIRVCESIVTKCD